MHSVWQFPSALRFEACEGWLAYAKFLSCRKLGELCYVAVRAEPAQSRFKPVQKIERGLCSLSRIRFLLVGYAHLEVRRHGGMIELVDFRH